MSKKRINYIRRCKIK